MGRLAEPREIADPVRLPRQRQGQLHHRPDDGGRRRLDRPGHGAHRRLAAARACARLMRTRMRSGIPPPAAQSRAIASAARRAATPDKIALIVVGDADAPKTAETLDLCGARPAPCAASPPGCSAEGLRPGDRMLLRLPNTSDYALLFFGAIAAGLVPIPVSSQLTEGEAALPARRFRRPRRSRGPATARRHRAAGCRVLDASGDRAAQSRASRSPATPTPPPRRRPT